MLGLILIYFIGKRFQDLAKTYDKHKWGFAIAVVASYYVGTFIAGILIVFYQELQNTNSYGTSDLSLSLLSITFGLGTCFGFYKILENSWKKKIKKFNLDLLDD